MIVRLRMGAAQASAVEINITDPAHDEEREPWWPRVEGASLVFDSADRDAVWSLMCEACNGEDYHADHGRDAEERKAGREARDALQTLTSRVLRCVA